MLFAKCFSNIIFSSEYDACLDGPCTSWKTTCRTANSSGQSVYPYTCTCNAGFIQVGTMSGLENQALCVLNRVAGGAVLGERDLLVWAEHQLQVRGGTTRRASVSRASWETRARRPAALRLLRASCSCSKEDANPAGLSGSAQQRVLLFLGVQPDGESGAGDNRSHSPTGYWIHPL